MVATRGYSLSGRRDRDGSARIGRVPVATIQLRTRRSSAPSGSAVFTDPAIDVPPAPVAGSA